MLVTLVPKNISFNCQEGETVYAAAARADIRFPISCKNGVCHICRGELLSGKVISGIESEPVEALNGESKTLMLCHIKPLSSCEIRIEDVYAKGELPVKQVSCQVVSVEQIQSHIYVAQLLLPAGKQPDFFAGQYLSLDLPGRSTPCYFSIASRPGVRTLELHIQADPHLENALEVVRYLESSKSVKVKLPFGKACLPEVPTQPLILMAAGTGFAQMKSIVEFLLANNFSHAITLYWGVRKAEDMYLKPLALLWQQKNPQFRFIEIIADMEDQLGVEHHNQMAEAVVASNHDLGASLVFVSGSPRLVFSVLGTLEENGLPTAQLFSDVLEYSERP